jgi:hypothetical protein
MRRQRIAAVAGALSAVLPVALGSYELVDGRWIGLFWLAYAAWFAGISIKSDRAAWGAGNGSR